MHSRAVSLPLANATRHVRYRILHVESVEGAQRTYFFFLFLSLSRSTRRVTFGVHIVALSRKYGVAVFHFIHLACLSYIL